MSSETWTASGEAWAGNGRGATTIAPPSAPPTPPAWTQPADMPIQSVQPVHDEVASPSPSLEPSTGRELARGVEPRRTATESVGAVLTVIGVLICSFIVYSLVLTDLSASRSQQLLRHELKERFTVERAVSDSVDEVGTVGDSRAAFGDATGGTPSESTGGEGAAGADEATDEATAEIERSIERPAVGAAVALLRIAKADVDHVVVEGSAHEQTATGPGHFRGSPLPGRTGNVVIAGRRTTHGAAFEHLGRLKRGDSIELMTGRGTFEYRVDSLLVVTAGQSDVLAQDGSNRLTLVTADEPFDGKGRLVVTARPVGTNQPRQAAIDDRARLAVPGAELGLGADGSAWGPILLWGQLLAVAFVGLRWARRRWTPVALWLVGAPTVMALSVLFFEAAGRLLPATV